MEITQVCGVYWSATGNTRRTVEHIAQALAEAGSLRAAARRLQMDPATLLRRKKKYQAQRRLLPDGFISKTPSPGDPSVSVLRRVLFSKQNSLPPLVSLCVSSQKNSPVARSLFDPAPGEFPFSVLFSNFYPVFLPGFLFCP